jgi:hypothetical protein
MDFLELLMDSNKMAMYIHYVIHFLKTIIHLKDQVSENISQYWDIPPHLAY